MPLIVVLQPSHPHTLTEMGGHLLDILCYALALDSSGELVAMFPVTFASSLLYLPCAEWSAACDEIMSRLSYYVLPKCIGEGVTACLCV